MAGYEAPTSYYVRLLELALAGEGPWTLQPSADLMLQGRAIQELRRGQRVRVLWTMTSVEREQQLRPIRIPIDKGLFGWRVALVPRDRKQVLADVRSLQDLSRWRAVQGHDWPDTRILQHNQLPTILATSESNLHYNMFRMLERGRADYFPRSVMEVADEATDPGHAGLAVDEHLLLVYPSALYFFVRPGDEPLAQALERGLERAAKEGSLDALLKQEVCARLAALHLGQRQVLHLENPLLPAQTPLRRKELWLDPATVTAACAKMPP